MLLARITHERDMVGKCQIPQKNRYIVPLYLFDVNLAICQPFPVNWRNKNFAVVKTSNKYENFSKKCKKSWETAVLQEKKYKPETKCRMLEWSQKEC